MRVVIAAKTDRRQISAAVRYAYRKQFRAYYVLGSFGVLFGALCASGIPEGGEIWAPSLIACGLLLLAWPSGVVAYNGRRNRRFHDLPVEYELDDQGLNIRHELVESRVRWPAALRAAFAGDLLLIWLAKRHFVVIPVHDLTAEQHSELRDLLHGRGLLADRRAGAPR